MAGFLVLAGTACGGSDDPGGRAPEPSIAVPEGITRSTTTTSTTTSTINDDPLSSTDSGGVVLVEAEGLAGHRLGSSEEAVVGTVDDLLGEPGRTEAVQCPGGSDRIVWWDVGLGAVFSDDYLTGWVLARAADPPPDPSVNGSPPNEPTATATDVVIATMDGIGIGATVAELQAAFPRNFQWVPDSTLGVEFYIGTGYPYLGGLASGEQPDDTVEHLWAGDSCSFR